MTIPRPSLILAALNALCAVALGAVGLLQRQSARKHAAQYAYIPTTIKEF